jgi:arylsulfatase B
MWLLLSCTEDPPPDIVQPDVPPPDVPPPNVLILVLDDVGTDKIAAYGEHPEPPRTPHLDTFAAQGTLFRNAWAYGTCSPTRAAVVTGRYGRRTGVGGLIDPNESDLELPLSEITLPEMLQEAPHDWSTSLVGKWHLSSYTSPSALSHPGDQGFDWYAAVMGNLGNCSEPGCTSGYYEWQEDVNGALSWRTDYAPSVQVDRALERMDEMPSPWLLYVGFSAVHAPFELPPAALLQEPVPEGAPLYTPTLEALDTELGRLLAEVDLEDTLVILLADNGTPAYAILPPLLSWQGKDTMYEGGIGVPMLMAGPGVQPGESQALVHAVDVFATVADVAGVELAHAVDGQSLLSPGHEVLYTERFWPNGHLPRVTDLRAVRDARFKLAVDELSGQRWLFDLQGRPDDGPDLLAQGPLCEEAEAARVRLESALDELRLSLP